MFDLAASDKNRITINDTRSGTQIELTYRNPTTQEEIDYQAKAYKRKGKKFYVNTGVKIKSALDILTGFREGDFGIDGKQISSDPGSAHYHPDWKGLLLQSASHILIAFASAVFEGARVDNELAGDLEYVAIEESDNDLPLQKSSGE